VFCRNQGGFFTLQRRRVAVRAEDLAGQGPPQNRQEVGGVPRPQNQGEQDRREQGDGGRIVVDGDAEHVSPVLIGVGEV